MGYKGQKYKSYSTETKLEAIRLHVEEKWSYRRITEKFDIHDPDRVRKWMRRFRKQGELGLLDQRGKPHTYVDENRELKELRRQVDMLKKCLEIWKQGCEGEVRHYRSIGRDVPGLASL